MRMCDFCTKNICAFFFSWNYWPICYEMIYVNQINMVARHGQNEFWRRKTFMTPNHRKWKKKSVEISHRRCDFSFLNWKLRFIPLTEYTRLHMPCNAIPWFDLSVNFVKTNKSVEQIKCFDACSSQNFHAVQLNVFKCHLSNCCGVTCITTRAKNLDCPSRNLATATETTTQKTRNGWQIFLQWLLNPKANEWMIEWTVKRKHCHN